MPSGRGARRIWVLLVAAGIVAAPAAVLRLLCAGRACDRPGSAGATAPFCSLRPGIRDPIRAGFREGRSPEVMAVTREPVLVGGSAFGRRGSLPPWPSLESGGGDTVPLAFAGTGVSSDRAEGLVRLDAVAPTVADVVGLERPHRRVRSGAAIPGVATGERPRLVVEVVWRGVSTSRLTRTRGEWPVLRGLMRSGVGARAVPGSLPLDPAAVLTTIGAGGLPFQHGVTGTLVRNDDGRLVRAWGRGAPTSVIATLADDLDRQRAERPLVGLVAARGSDRGLIGEDWYVDGDRDRVVLANDPPRAAVEVLARGFGRDRVVDLLAVVDEGRVAALDRGLGAIVRAARRAAGGSVAVVVTATGSAPLIGDRPRRPESIVRAVERALGADVIEAVAPGGLFVNQRVLVNRSLTEDRIVRALRAVSDGSGRRLFADVFSAIAVSFGRYC